MTKKVIVTEYQDIWEKAFNDLKLFLEEHIACENYLIEHVGSTSVKGLSAKPIIDLVIIIPDRTYFECIKKELEKLDYIHNGNQGIIDREAFKLVKPKKFYDHHLYVSYPDSLSTRNQLCLRDHLRINNTNRDEYGNLKKRLAKKYEYDIDSYIKGKSDFILSILKQYDFTEEELKTIFDANDN